MADTQRTIAELLALLADNSTGDISEQDLRDVVVSLANSYGGFHVSTPIETAIALVNTPVKALGTTTVSGAVRGMDMPADNRLRYTGAPTRFHTIRAALSVISAASNKVFEFYIAKNGVVDTTSGIRRKQGTSSDEGALALEFHIQLAQNDYVEVWVENVTDASNMTITRMVLTGEGLVE